MYLQVAELMCLLTSTSAYVNTKIHLKKKSVFFPGKSSKLLGFGAILVVAVAIPLTVLFSQSQTNIFQHAAGPEPTMPSYLTGQPTGTALSTTPPLPPDRTSVITQRSKEHLAEMNAQLQGDLKQGKNMQYQNCSWHYASSNQNTWYIGGGYIWWYVEIDTLQPWCHDWGAWGFMYNGTWNQTPGSQNKLWVNGAQRGWICADAALPFQYSSNCGTGTYPDGWGVGQASATGSYNGRQSSPIWTLNAYD